MIRVLAGAGAAALVGALLAATASPADAATAYRYWSLWDGTSGAWQYSLRGPSAGVHDGDVVGWRFAVQTKSGSAAVKPRHEPNFDALCRDTARVAGKIRVALVVDFGTAADAPKGQAPPAAVTSECVNVAPTADGVAVLTAAEAELRSEGGLLCAIRGYPARECAPVVQSPSSRPAPKAPDAAAQRRPAAPTPRPPHGPRPAVTPATAPAPPSAPSSPTPSIAAVPPASAASAATRPSPDAAATPNVRLSDVRASTAAGGGSGSLPAAALGGALVLALGGGAAWQYRRRAHR